MRLVYDDGVILSPHVHAPDDPESANASWSTELHPLFNPAPLKSISQLAKVDVLLPDAWGLATLTD